MILFCCVSVHVSKGAHVQLWKTWQQSQMQLNSWDNATRHAPYRQLWWKNGPYVLCAKLGVSTITSRPPTGFKNLDFGMFDIQLSAPSGCSSTCSHCLHLRLCCVYLLSFWSCSNKCVPTMCLNYAVAENDGMIEMILQCLNVFKITQVLFIHVSAAENDRMNSTVSLCF